MGEQRQIFKGSAETKQTDNTYVNTRVFIYAKSHHWLPVILHSHYCPTRRFFPTLIDMRPTTPLFTHRGVHNPTTPRREGGWIERHLRKRGIVHCSSHCWCLTTRRGVCASGGARWGYISQHTLGARSKKK